MRKLLIVAAAATLIFSSCATLLDGNKTRIRVTGTPEKANVYVNGSFQGTAPTTVRVKKQSLKQGGTIEVKADGYEAQTTKIYRKVRWGFVVGDAVCGFVPLVIDVINGNIYGARPKKVRYKLLKK